MAGTITPIYHCKGTLPIPGYHITNRARLEELVGERATEVLPALQSLFLEELKPSEPVQKVIDKFVATRQLSNHPIVISHWNGKPAPWWRFND